MSGYQYTLLDISDQGQIETYERSLYIAFSNSYIKTLDSIWDFDNKARRIRTKIPYDQQHIYVITLGRKILAGAAVNYDIQNTLQLELMGFKIDKTGVDKCEALLLFNLLDSVTGLSIFKKLNDHLLKYLIDSGKKVIYGTCSEKRLRAYQMLGFTAIDKRVFKGEQKYLLLMQLGGLPT